MLTQPPIERLFETVEWGQTLTFGDEVVLRTCIAAVNRMHKQVEKRRGMHIPAWAYRDVLFFAHDYTERGYMVVHGPIALTRRDANYGWWMAMGKPLHVEDLPTTYAAYRQQREADLQRDIA